MAIRIGCGSWADQDYVGLLYPKGLPATSRLGTYTRWFERVELNTTYHATPPRDRIAGWVAQTPDGFLFDVKLPRAFSENPRSAAENGLAERFLAALEPIVAARKIGAFLLTLAPFFGPQRHRLEELNAVAGLFSPLAPVAVELRDRAWIEGAALASTLAYFRSHRLAWVALDLPRLDAAPLLPPIDEVTHPTLAYLRLHGRNPDYLNVRKAEERHAYAYSAAELAEIVARIRSLATRARDVHVSVNNHYADFAPKSALALRRLLGQPVPPLAPGDDSGHQLSLL